MKDPKIAALHDLISVLHEHDGKRVKPGKAPVIPAKLPAPPSPMEPAPDEDPRLSDILRKKHGY